MLLVINRVEPSAKVAFTPAGWRLRAVLCELPEPVVVQGGFLGYVVALQ